MIYLFRYSQKTRDDIAYRRLCNALADSGYIHEISRGEILVVPNCQIYNYKKQLLPLLSPRDELLTIPVLINDFADPVARRFVDQWMQIEEERGQRLIRDYVWQMQS